MVGTRSINRLKRQRDFGKALRTPLDEKLFYGVILFGDSLRAGKHLTKHCAFEKLPKFCVY